MTEDQTPAPEAGDEAVREDQPSASEATENTEGQEQDPPADPDNPEEGEGEESVSPSKARRERRKAEMERLRNEAEEAKRERANYEARRDKIKADAEKSSQPPKEAEFGDYNEYLIALGAYQAARQWGERESREIDEQISAQDERIKEVEAKRQEEVAEEWAAQVEDAKTRYADFEQVVFTVPFTDDLTQMILDSDQSADLAYFLGKNREEAAKISKMPHRKAERAIGAIEARLSLPKPKTTTETPDPIDPVKPKATASKDPSNMSNAEYRKWRGLARS